MEQARRFGMPTGETALRRPEARTSIAQIEKVLHVAFPRDAAAKGPPAAQSADRDFAGAIEMVREAAQAIRAAETRASEAEQRMDELIQRATEELRSAEMRVQRAEDRARAAEARSADATERLREAEEWLSRIYSVISEELPQR